MQHVSRSKKKTPKNRKNKIQKIQLESQRRLNYIMHKEHVMLIRELERLLQTVNYNVKTIELSSKLVKVIRNHDDLLKGCVLKKNAEHKYTVHKTK